MQTNSNQMPAASTRRSFLSQAASVAAGGAVLAMATSAPASAATAPASPLAAADASAVSADPIFAMIDRHKMLRAEWQAVYYQLDEADPAAAQEHGRRPVELIHWRNYTIGASEIDTRRESLLDAGEIDPATVEQEYLDAKARYKAQVEAGLAWDERTGLAALRKDVGRRSTAEWRYAKRLADTKPATPAGAAALIQYILDDELNDDEDYWHMTALRSAVAALNSMGAKVES
jgi:hypothetical protein